MENNTQVHILDGYRGRIGNVIFEDASFFGPPNFRGVDQSWGPETPQFKLVVPQAAVEPLLSLKWNVRTTTPSSEEVEPVSYIKIKVDENSLISIHHNGVETLIPVSDRAIIDNSRFASIDCEFRGWEYEPGNYSARLVKAVLVLKPDFWSNKYDGSLMR